MSSIPAVQLHSRQRAAKTSLFNKIFFSLTQPGIAEMKEALYTVFTFLKTSCDDHTLILEEYHQEIEAFGSAEVLGVVLQSSKLKAPNTAENTVSEKRSQILCRMQSQFSYRKGETLKRCLNLTCEGAEAIWGYESVILHVTVLLKNN